MRVGCVRWFAALSAWMLLAGPVAAQDALKLGVLNDLTGSFADLGGRGSIVAAQMAVEDFGSSVLGKPISIVSADSQNKPDIAAGIARRWFDAENVDAIIGPGDPVIYPEHLTEELDYELELAVVLKKAGKHFSPEEASDYVGGYVIFNDITARDIQRREMKSGVFSFCKGIDTFCPLGPWIVTADEIPDPHNLAMELRVNGEPRQRSHSGKMSVKIPEILSQYSPMGYSAGDVVSTGTVSGVAAFSGDPKAWYLKPGDIMECEIEKIGILRNRVISWEEAYGHKPEAMATQEPLK